MKAWLVYWIIGCAISGLSTGGYIKRCPHDEVPLSEVVAVTAVWPAFFFAILTAGDKIEKQACKLTSAQREGE